MANITPKSVDGNVNPAQHTVTGTLWPDCSGVDYTCPCKGGYVIGTVQLGGSQPLMVPGTVVDPQRYCPHDPDAEAPFSVVLEADSGTDGRTLIRLGRFSSQYYGDGATKIAGAAAELFHGEIFVKLDERGCRTEPMRRGRDGQHVPVSAAWLQRELTFRCRFIEPFERGAWQAVAQCPPDFAVQVLKQAWPYGFAIVPVPPSRKMIGAAAHCTYEQMLAVGWTDALMLEHGMMKP